MDELGKPYGVTKQAVGTVLKNNDIKAVKKRMFSDKQEQQIIQSYQSGKSLEAVANEFGCHSVSIVKILKKHNIPRQDYRIIDFSDNDIEKMKTLYCGGKTTYELSEMFNCDPGVISRRLSDNGIELRAGQFERQVTKEDETKAIELYQSGLTSEQIGNEIGFSQGTVLDILKRHNIDRRNSRNFTDSEEAEIGKLYQAGFSAKQITRAYGLNHHISIVAAIRRQGIEIRSNHDANRLYLVNHNFFDVIDTEEKAYILGFVYADGAVHKRSLIVTLSSKDKKQLEKIKACLQSEHPINDHIRKAWKGGKRYKASTLNITHGHLAKRLKSLGIIKKRPNLENCISQIPNHLIHHWIRGLIDGDGSFHTKPGFGIVGGKPLLEFIRKTFTSEIELNPNIKIHKHPTAKVYSLVYGGRIQAQKIANYLYKDATIWLERKREVVENYPEPMPRTKNKSGQ